MSVSLILIPTALAVATAIGGAGVAGVAANSRATKDDDRREAKQVRVQTRMKDAELLASALQDIGAVDVDSAADRLTGIVDGLSLTMARDEDGVWTAHVVGADGREATRTEATALIERLDAAYARHVQAAVAARIRDRADHAGFELLSESRQEDDSVMMVLGVREQR